MPMINVPMDQELYEAALKVMDEIDARLRSDRKAAPEELMLGRPLVNAYERWQSMLVSKYTRDDPEPEPEAPPEPIEEPKPGSRRLFRQNPASDRVGPRRR